MGYGDSERGMARGRTMRLARGSNIVNDTKAPAMECHRKAFPYLGAQENYTPIAALWD